MTDHTLQVLFVLLQTPPLSKPVKACVFLKKKKNEIKYTGNKMGKKPKEKTQQ